MASEHAVRPCGFEFRLPNQEVGCSGEDGVSLVVLVIRFYSFVFSKGLALCAVLSFATHCWRLHHEEALRLDNPQSNR